jgi:hypothetical protein
MLAAPPTHRLYGFYSPRSPDFLLHGMQKGRPIKRRTACLLSV